MNYWIVYKIVEGKPFYISGTDEHCHPTLTENESEAIRCYRFNTAMIFCRLGFSILKKTQQPI